MDLTAANAFQQQPYTFRIMEPTVPTAKGVLLPEERKKLRRIVVQRGLCGLANDTKWDEFIAAMRAPRDWIPKYRCKCIDAPPSLYWDTAWFYHLPFPLLSVEWLDIEFLQTTYEHRLPPRIHVTDHSPWLEEVLNRVGLDYRKGKFMIRIFGYAPRDMELFDQACATRPT
jgi:hypothetical protein